VHKQFQPIVHLLILKLEKNDTTIGEYVYDGDGRRLQATENSVTTTYIHDGSEIKYEENTNSTTTYIYGPTGRLARRTTINQVSNTYYYHTDHLSSTRLVTDTSKNIVAAATYHPFGTLSTIEGLERYLYTGKEKDAIGLYYYGARYYDPEIDRFLTRDPYTSLPDDPRTIGATAGAYAGSKNPRTLNRYSYAGNNPVKFNDPTGLCFDCAEMRYELTRENSLDLIEDWWELISIDLDDYFGVIFRSLGAYLGAPSPGFGQMCYYVAVQVCVDKETGVVREKRIRPPCWYDTEAKDADDAKRICKNQADSDKALGLFLYQDDNETCTIEVKDGCESEDDPAPTETPDQTDPPVGPCTGTSLLIIFLGIAIFTTSLQGKREELKP
jgi:RHS repeat-associated protein